MKTHKRFICPAPRLGVTVLALALLGLAVECRGVEASSDPSAVWVKPDESLQWKTVMSASAALTLNWPSGATSALQRKSNKWKREIYLAKWRYL